MEPPYGLVITPSAQKDLTKIDKTYHKAILSAVNKLKNNPKMGKPLKDELKRTRRIRVSRYRAIYSINHSSKTVFILIIDHRKDVYR